jgi:mRNA interferase MazF
MNQSLRTVVVAPMTSRGRPYPWRIPVTFRGRAGQIALDQIRTVDRERLVRRVGRLDAGTAQNLLDALAEMFAP